MTEHKSRKNLVRRRMARTGESYTTANRQVTTHRPSGDIPGAVPGYPGFGVEVHRPSSLCRHLLGQAGLPLSEAMVCGLGGGIGFLYAVFEYRTEPIPMLTIVAQHHPEPWLAAVTRNLGITTARTTSTTPSAALGKLDRALDAGRPALITVGRGLLPWHPGVDPVENADGFPIVVAGRRDGDYLIDDRDAAPHRIDRHVLGEAWAAHRKGRFGLTTLGALPARVDLPTATVAAITTTVDHLTGPVLGNYFDANMGLTGMARLAEDLADTRTKRGWTKRFPTDDAFRATMQRLTDCLTWQHTAAGGTRPAYARFLSEASGVTGLDLSGAASHAQRSGQSWLQAADLAAAAVNGGDRPAILRTLADLVGTALAAETEMVGKLRPQLGLGIKDSAPASSSSS